MEGEPTVWRCELCGRSLQPEHFPPLLGRAQVQYHQQPDLRCLPQQGGSSGSPCPEPRGTGLCLSQWEARQSPPSRTARGTGTKRAESPHAVGRSTAPGFHPLEASSSTQTVQSTPVEALPRQNPCSGVCDQERGHSGVGDGPAQQ